MLKSIIRRQSDERLPDRGEAGADHHWSLPDAITYSHAASLIGANKRQMRGPLDLIAMACTKHGLPPITLMACKAATKGDLVPMPGDAAFDPKTDRLLVTNIPRYEIAAWQAKVRSFDWTPYLRLLSDAATYQAVDTPKEPPEPIAVMTRRVPNSMVATLDTIIGTLKPISASARESVSAKLLAELPPC